MVRGAGFEPAPFPCKIKGSRRSDSPNDSPKFRGDPELAQVVAAWASLPPLLKAAVLAIVGSQSRND
jgi:hypothetical protein